MICAALYPISLRAASLDCNSDRLTPSDRLVCSDPVLSKLDSDLAVAYADAQARSLPEQKITLSAGRRLWLARKASCGDTLCLADLYSFQLGELDGGSTPAARIEEWAHEWIRVDERDLFDGVMTGHTITEVDASSIVHESADMRTALVRSTTTIESRVFKQVMTAHYAVGCRSQVFVVRDANVTVTDEDEAPQTAKVAGGGDVISASVNRMDSTIVDYACAH